MICPECGTECGAAALCTDCGAALTDGEKLRGEGDWTRLLELTDEAEASLVQGYLESAGIPCELESLVFHAEPFRFGPLAKVRVYVLRGHVRAAQKLLAEAREA